MGRNTVLPREVSSFLYSCVSLPHVQSDTAGEKPGAVSVEGTGDQETTGEDPVGSEERQEREGDATENKESGGGDREGVSVEPSQEETQEETPNGDNEANGAVIIRGADSSEEKTSEIDVAKVFPIGPPPPRVVPSGPPPPIPDLPYTEPHWSGPPGQDYSLTVIKSGTVQDEIDLSSKPFLVCNRHR